MESFNDEVQKLLARIQEDDQAAANELFQRFQRRMFKLLNELHADVNTTISRKFAPEDVSQSVWRTFFRRHKAGEYEFRHWAGIWALLALIARRKFKVACKRFRCQKRDSGIELTVQGSTNEALICWQTLADDPTPDEATALAELLDQVLVGLSPKQQLVFQAHLDNPPDNKHESKEEHNRRIANDVAVSEATVRRWLTNIEKDLEKRLHSDE